MPLAVHQDGVGTSLGVGRGPQQGLVEPPAGDERLGAGHHHEVGVDLGVLGRADLAAELVDVGQGLAPAVEVAVGLGEELVLEAHPGHAPLLELAHEPAHVVEVAVPRVAVEQDGHVGGVGHELENLEHLGPARLVAVAHAEGRGDRQAAGPEGLKPGLGREPRRESVVGLHQHGESR